MKTEHGTNTNGLEKECPFLTVGISMMISSVSLSMYPSLAMNRGTMSLKSPRLRRSEQRQSGSWNCLRWLFKAVSPRHKCVPSHSPWYGTIWGLHHFGWLVCLCGGLLVRGGFLAFCTLDFGPGTYIAKLWPEGFPENVRLQFLQPMDYKTMSNSLPLPGSNPNGKANFQSASSRTYVSFTKYPVAALCCWEMKAACLFCCEINSSRGMLHQPHLGMVSDLYTCFGNMSYLFHR